MKKNILVVSMLIVVSYLAGCATVPLASPSDDAKRKEFSSPPQNVAGVYIFRDSGLGGALKKTISIDKENIGETAPNTYFYKDVKPGKHELSTESEFSDNILEVDFEGGKNYFVRQTIKFGLFVGGAILNLVSEDEGRKGVLECELAQ